jgi:hypothetical protein
VRLSADLERFHRRLDHTHDAASRVATMDLAALEIPPLPIEDGSHCRWIVQPKRLSHQRCLRPFRRQSHLCLQWQWPARWWRAKPRRNRNFQSRHRWPLQRRPGDIRNAGWHVLARAHGIVMLLTGLVFLGTYAYKNFIGRFGPAGKVTLLYVAGAALLGAGAWLQRKREKESLRNYGQVLFAGGLAAVYFTTYAAHYVAVLRVIASPLLDGFLLLAWAAFIVWIADRRKSEVLAVFAVALAYYTSAITNIGLFTLYSNAVLTMAAVFFLVRNRWTTLSFISVVATYGGFAFWRFHGDDWSWNARLPEVWQGNFFLGAYWLVFTAAVFLSRAKTFVTPIARSIRV